MIRHNEKNSLLFTFAKIEGILELTNNLAEKVD